MRSAPLPTAAAAGAPLIPARMIGPMLAGAAALATAVSWAPRIAPSLSASGTAPAERPADGRALLRGLALDVPDDVADTPVSPDAPAPLAAATPFSMGTASSADVLRAEDCLTAAVYYEARSEPLDGQRAVAQVVLNRVRDRAFPRTVCGVVYQGAERRTGCQFSFTCDGSTNRPRDPDAWERARAVAAMALAGAVFAPVGSATHYHASSMLPWWAPSLARIGAVGAHVFYRWGGRLERALTFRQDYAGAEPDAPMPAFGPGTADWPDDALVAGVRVHRPDAELAADAPVPIGVEEAGGVTVHRGATLAARFLGTGTGPRSFSAAAGVRVHRGTGPAADGEVSEETS